jgi:hypothetical protein
MSTTNTLLSDLYTNYAANGIQKIQSHTPGKRRVSAVEFERFDATINMKANVIIPWQKALEYLRATGASVVRVFWEGDTRRDNYGWNGWSWASWRKGEDGLYRIMAGAGNESVVLEELSFEPR